MQPPVNEMNYPTYLWQLIIDKTGTIYQTLNGNVGTGTPWGTRVWRIPPGKPAELIYYVDGNGQLYVDQIKKRLLFLGTDANRRPFYIVIEGYIHPADCPDSTIVNINETQTALLKQGIATANSTANSAYTLASNATQSANDARAQITNLQKQISDLQLQINAMQTKIIPRSQIEDIVWSKIWDVNYLIRMGFISGSSTIEQVQQYLIDLASYIKRVMK